MAATPAGTRKTHRRVRDSVFHISLLLSLRRQRGEEQVRRHPDAWPKMPTGTIIKRRALFNQVIAPAREGAEDAWSTRPPRRGEAEHDRDGEPDELLQARVGEVEPGGKGEAAAPRRKSAGRKFRNAPARTPRRTPPSRGRVKEQPSRDDPGVVDQGASAGRKNCFRAYCTAIGSPRCRRRSARGARCASGAPRATPARRRKARGRGG